VPTPNFVPRFARAIVSQCPHHITQRGNERRDIFFSPTDREVYLGLLKHNAKLYPTDVLGFCLMTNHVHLVLRPHQALSLAKVMRVVQMRYSQYRHALERGNGHLWQSRYYSCAVEPERLGVVMRYVELNPVRAGLVANADRYPWSSAGVHLGARDPWGLVDMADWRQSWTAKEWARELATAVEDVGAIRDATYSGRPLGSREFVGRLEQHLKRKLEKGSPGRPPKTREASIGEM
jgi:putative transposase